MLAFTSLISSQVKNVVAPTLLAIEITYLALFSTSSGVVPGYTNSLLIALDSIDFNKANKY